MVFERQSSSVATRRVREGLSGETCIFLYQQNLRNPRPGVGSNSSFHIHQNSFQSMGAGAPPHITLRTAFG